MSLNPNHLVTLSEMRAWLGIASSVVQVEADLILEDLINSTSSMIEFTLDRKLILATANEIFEGNGSRDLELLQYPIRSVASIYEAYTTTFDGTHLIPVTDYTISSSGLAVILSNRTTFYRSNISVSYTYGYDSPSTPGTFPLPSNLKQAAKLYVEWMYAVRNDRRLGINNKSKNGESVSYAKMPEQIDMLLAPFKRELFIPTHPVPRFL